MQVGRWFRSADSLTGLDFRVVIPKRYELRMVLDRLAVEDGVKQLFSLLDKVVVVFR